MALQTASIIRSLGLAAVLWTAGSTACWAQQTVGSPGMGGNGIGPVVTAPQGQGGAQAGAPREAPAALPGAKSDPSKVAPATKLPSDMNPTDALFDAINRGDLTAARDAVNRGADLDGHNVLGMTPMELSVDLSRNDISFMLLSMRGGGDSGASAPPPGTKTAAAKPAREVREVRVKASVAHVTPPPAPRVARLFSGDGGTPVPASGFLGFDSSGRN